tara:strand:- start:104 stop:439 length:336 start_codon:yes stop_codon:yes gene_type:complete
MAIQVSGTQVIGNSRELTNITAVDSTTVTAMTNAGLGGGGAPAHFAVGAYSNGGQSSSDIAAGSTISNFLSAPVTRENRDSSLAHTVSASGTWRAMTQSKSGFGSLWLRIS